MFEDSATPSVSSGSPEIPSADRSKQTNNALIASDSRGRLRIRLNRESRTSEMMQRITERFSNSNGVLPIESNPETGSVVINYDPEKHRRGEIMSMLEDAGVIIRAVGEGLGEELPDIGRSHTSENLITAFNHLDRRLSLATGYRIDLKIAFPLALGSIGAWRVVCSGLGLTEIPAYVLLWYAFDSFFKLNMATAQSTPLPEPSAS